MFQGGRYSLKAWSRGRGTVATSRDIRLARLDGERAREGVVGEEEEGDEEEEEEEKEGRRARIRGTRRR